MSVQLVSVQNSITTYTPEQVDLVKRTVAEKATNDELKMFLYLAGQYNLDPFKKEIWFVKYGNEKPLIMTSRDGYLRYALMDPNFNGLKSFVIYEGDDFQMDSEKDLPLHKSGSNYLKKSKIIGAWAAAFHKQRKPAVAVVSFEEYNKGKNTWQTNPGAMIQKVAEVFVLKRQFGISGLVTREEMDAGEEAPIHTQSEVIEPEIIDNPPLVKGEDGWSSFAKKGDAEFQQMVDNLPPTMDEVEPIPYEELPKVEKKLEDKTRKRLHALRSELGLDEKAFKGAITNWLAKAAEKYGFAPFPVKSLNDLAYIDHVVLDELISALSKRAQQLKQGAK